MACARTTASSPSTTSAEAGASSRLVVRGEVRPDQILGLTFTRKATGELAERVTAALARLAGSGLIIEDRKSVV